MLAAEATHRAHAVVEQVIADLKNGPLAHLPSGVFNANAAWLALCLIAFNLLRPAGAVAAPRPGLGLAVATTATLPARLVTVPTRKDRSIPHALNTQQDQRGSEPITTEVRRWIWAQRGTAGETSRIWLSCIK